MKTLIGKSIFKGISIGNIQFYEKKQHVINRNKIEDPEKEINRIENALQKTKEQLKILYDKAVIEVGKANAEIFEIHEMMLQDDDYVRAIKDSISAERISAEYAVETTKENFAKIFENMEDEYMRARSADIRDVSDRVISNLMGNENTSWLENPSIIVAEDLAPSETIQMDKKKLLSFVTKEGSLYSHTAILARTMNIPALIGVDISKEWDNKLAIVDGYEGLLVIEPDEDTFALYQKKKFEEEESANLLKELIGKPNVTPDGREIELYANIGNIDDLQYVLQNDAAGIGLFRSEFLYLEKSSYPTEDEQFAIYKQVLETMAGKPVIIRTLDIGADKKIDYFNLDEEENPALGFRAIRICLKRQDIFKTQLRALLRSSIYGELSIMYPMIISVDEVLQIKQIISEVKEELTAEGIPFKDVPEGIMIETPAAVMISDLLAKEVDFFSIGTNDLTQYTLALDRQNNKLEDFYNPHHEAILRMIDLVIHNAHREDVWVGICGELGADISLLGRFLEMSVDELSVSPSSILPIRKAIREYK